MAWFYSAQTSRMRTLATGYVYPGSQTHPDTFRLIPQCTGCGSVLVQLVRQVGDDPPQPHHLLVVVRVHYRHCAASDLKMCEGLYPILWWRRDLDVLAKQVHGVCRMILIGPSDNRPPRPEY